MTKKATRKKSGPKAAAQAAAAGPRPAAARRSTDTGEGALQFADTELVAWMQKNPGEVIKQRQECLRLLQKRRCSYGRSGGALPLTLVPLVLKKSSLDKLAHVSEVLDRAMDKVVTAYPTDEYVQSQFPYPDIPPEWIKWDPGYPKPTVISRHDALFDGEELKFIEFNTDNPGARAWVDIYEEVFREMPMYQDLIGKQTGNSDRRQMRAMHEIFKDYWAKYGDGTKKPRVALSTFKEYLPGSEWEILRDYLIEHGMEANFVDSREFEYRDGKLFSGRVQFHILHLCLRFTFFKRFPREHADFFAGIRDKAVLTLNHFRAAIGSQKEIMSFMTNPVNAHYFDDEENDLIGKHIPWTRRMDESITISPEGRDVVLTDYALHQREKLVLKITTGAGGQDVFVGKSCDKNKWADAVEMASGCPWWILQEAVNIPEYEIPVVKDNQVVLEKKLVNLNPYVFDGKYVGSVARVSQSDVINVAAGGGVMPVLEAK